MQDWKQDLTKEEKHELKTVLNSAIFALLNDNLELTRKITHLSGTADFYHNVPSMEAVQTLQSLVNENQRRLELQASIRAKLSFAA